MRDTCKQPSRSNPFSTRFVRPGAIDYLFAPSDSPQAIVERLARFGWRGQIVGQHGTGKSTLLAALAGPLLQAGRCLSRVDLHDGQRRMPRDWIGKARESSANLILIDGYEQLGYWARYTVNRQCRRHGWGLLVTVHRDVGIPTLVQTCSDLHTVQAIVRRLLGVDETRVSEDAVAECFRASRGDVREALFLLYDRFEALAP